jgi:1-acyl-sn-glycerol-3-phosphate acyltransferase
MDPANLTQFRFLRRLGVLSTCQLRPALRQLRAGRVVIIFPEGALMPPGPLARLEPGAAWLSAKASAPLVAVAVRVALRGHEAPEAYLDAQQVQQATPKALEGTLTRRLEALDTLLRESDPRAPLSGFVPVIRGRRSWDERLSRGHS